MSWTTSAILREWPKQTFQASGTGYTGLDSDVVKAALFGGSITPNRDAAVSEAGYGVGQWVASGEVSGASEWVAGGRELSGKTFSTPDAATFMFDAADLTGSASVTLSGAYGCLVYDDSITGGTVADQAVSFHYFGGSLSVTAGTFSVLWNVNGILRITV